MSCCDVCRHLRGEVLYRRAAGRTPLQMIDDGQQQEIKPQILLLLQLVSVFSNFTALPAWIDVKKKQQPKTLYLLNNNDKVQKHSYFKVTCYVAVLLLPESLQYQQ